MNFRSVSDGDARAPLLQTQTSIQRSGDIDHVYAFEEVVPGRRSAKRHSACWVFPNWYHDPGYVGGRGAPLERFLDACLFRWRALSKRSIHRDDDHVLSIALQMSHLKGGHCIHASRSRFSHVSWRVSQLHKMVNVDSVSSNCRFSITTPVSAFHPRTAALPSLP